MIINYYGGKLLRNNIKINIENMLKFECNFKNIF